MISPFDLLKTHLDLEPLTRLQSAPSGGQGAGPVPGSVEGCHAHHVRGVAGQVFKLHPELRQEKSAQAFRFILQLKLPEIDLQTELKKKEFRIFQQKYRNKKGPFFLANKLKKGTFFDTL